MPRFDAAKSLFSSTDKALAGNVGGQAREQTVLTPDWLLDAIRAVSPIALDPCTTAENPCEARRYFAADALLDAVERKPPFFGPQYPFACFGVDGLEHVWEPFVRDHGLAYVNPPYADLKRWMKQCYWEAKKTCKIYLLAPFRPQRRWFCEYTKGYDVVSLAPFPFKGHKSAFPAPLCLVCYNLSVPELGKYLTGVWRQ